MASALDSGREIRVRALAGDFVVFLSRTPFRQASDGLASRPGETGSRNTPSRFMLLKLEISSDVIVHLACMHNFFGYIRSTTHVLPFHA